MAQESPRPPQELVSGENYRRAFANILEARGLSVTAIEKANCSPFLEAETDEIDGAINLPPVLEKALFAHYEGVRAPRGDNKPVLVRRVKLGHINGIIEIEPKLVNYSKGPKHEDYITITEGGIAVNPEIYFLFEEGKYCLELVNVDTKGSIIHDSEGQEWYDLTPDMMDAFAGFLSELNQRQESGVSIYKNSTSK